MASSEDVGRGDDLLAPTPDDGLLGIARLVINAVSTIPVLNLVAALAVETLPTPTERQHARALRTLKRVVEEVREQVTAQDWRNVIGTEEFDAAAVRAIRAAEEAAVEEKREAIWFGLINGYVRTQSTANRDRFMRIVAKYDLEHFQALAKIQALVKERPAWLRVEGQICEAIGGDRHTARAYVHEFHGSSCLRV